MPLNPSNLNGASADKHTERWEISVRFDRSLDHARDDLETLRSKIRVYLTAHRDFDADRLSPVDVAIDTETGTATIVLEGDQEVTRSMVVRALRYRVLPSYNEASETNRPPLIKGDHGLPTVTGVAHRAYLKLPAEERTWETFRKKKPSKLNKRFNMSTIRDEEWRQAFDQVHEHEQQPESAPDVKIDEVYVRALAGDPAPFDTPAAGGEE